MTDPTPSTNDILSKIRAAKSAAAAGGVPTPPVTAPSEVAAVAPSKPEAAAPPADAPATAPVAPKATADILASLRKKPVADAAPVAVAAAPKGTADILAAVKKQAATPAVPSSPADVMAAIRAKGGSAPAAAAPAAPAAPAAKPAVTASGLSPADMIKAARSAEAGSPAAPKVVLPSKPLPGKAAAGVNEVPRRSAIEDLAAIVCSPVVIAWGSFLGALGASSLGLARFMMPNVLVEPPTKFKIGPPTDYAPGTVSTKWQAQFNIWVVNAEVDGVRSIYALSTVCTHLGCTPNWLEGEQKFKCPCHGSGFYKSGINFEGPAPRPLERVGVRLSEDGMLEVDKSVKFQRELGQWTNPSSFVGVG